jgi:peptidoglycan hydrolase CwlO-like protein
MIEEMEKHIGTMFQTIPDNAGAEEVSSQKNMKKLAQALEKYKNQIKDLEEHIVPTTPPQVTAWRDQDTTKYEENIV